MRYDEVLTAVADVSQVNVEDEPDIKSGFTITFFFEENPYFDNTQLQKKIRYMEDGTTEITSVPPKWLPGKVSNVHRMHRPCWHPFGLLQKLI